jgi:hypothetical protein
LQHDVSGQTFVNTFSADPVIANGGFLTINQIDNPEPATAALLAIGVGLLVGLHIRRKRVAHSA